MSNTATNQTSFKKDRELEAIFDPVTKVILSNFLITKDIQKDLEQAQDFGIYTANKVSVAVRWRRVWVKRKGVWINQMDRYGEQFTIRYKRKSGFETEIHKIRKGIVDLFLYGFGKEQLAAPFKYHIMNLDIFRKHEPKPIFTWENIDEKGSWGAAYRFNQFPSEFVKVRWIRPQS